MEDLCTKVLFVQRMISSISTLDILEFQLKILVSNIYGSIEPFIFSLFNFKSIIRKSLFYRFGIDHGTMQQLPAGLW